MAYATIEPFGPIHEDLRAGKICATVASGSLKKPDDSGFCPGDFFETLALPEQSRVLKADDPEEHSRLIMAAIFGKTE